MHWRHIKHDHFTDRQLLHHIIHGLEITMTLIDDIKSDLAALKDKVANDNQTDAQLVADRDAKIADLEAQLGNALTPEDAQAIRDQIAAISASVTPADQKPQ